MARHCKDPANRRAFIERMLAKGRNMAEIGEALGITRQRVYHLVTYFNLQTPERRRRGYWKEQSIQRQWAWRVLGAKVKNGDERHKVLNSIVFPTHCPITGVELDYGMGTKTGRGPNSPSVDRIDPRGGYVPGNVHVVSWPVNWVKMTAPPEHIIKLAEYLRGRASDD